MNIRLSFSVLLLIGLTLPAQAGAVEQQDKLLKEAVQFYNAGQVDRAIPLFLQDLKENPNNGTAHYYLGVALKKAGADANAISELEMAAKLLPAGVTQTLAKQALHAGFEEDVVVPPAPSAKTTAPAPQNWFSSVLSFFQPPAPAPTAPKPIVTPSFPSMPDLMQPVGDAWKDTRRWIRKQSNLVGIGKKPSTTRDNGSGEPDVIPMGEMLGLAEDSRSLNPRSQSHSSGVVRFSQAPENSAEWDLWIRKFRKTFDAQVFRHMFKDAKNEKTGIASVIFSVDRDGHLRGCVYTATADDTMQQCLLKAIRELDKSYVLAFPPGSGVSGWNFRMTWNFGKALTFVRMVREQRAKEAARPTFVKIDLNAIIKAKQQEQLAAQAKKLADKKKADLQKTKLAVRVPPPPVVKVGVSAQLIPKPKPVELKAVPLKLSDMPALPKASVRLTTDDMDDFNILNQDLSGLFH
jgi:tetratricopeptide (TPR) repeat protein